MSINVGITKNNFVQGGFTEMRELLFYSQTDTTSFLVKNNATTITILTTIRDISATRMKNNENNNNNNKQHREDM